MPLIHAVEYSIRDCTDFRVLGVKVLRYMLIHLLKVSDAHFQWIVSILRVNCEYVTVS